MSDYPRIVEKGQEPNWWYECSECNVELEEDHAANGAGTWQICPVCEFAWWEGEPLDPRLVDPQTEDK